MKTNRPEFNVNRPGALIAAVPAILGFSPEDSLVLVAIDGDQLGSVLRVDLGEQLTGTLDRLAEVTAAAHPVAAIAVIVDADAAGCPPRRAEHYRCCAALVEELDRYGITLWAAYLVDRVAAGGRWCCIDDCGAAGPIDDPAASPLAAAAVLDGRRLYRRRADLQAVVAADPVRRAKVAAVIADCAEQRAAEHRADPDGRARADVERVIAAAGAFGTGRRPSAVEVAELGCVLDDVTVRDTLFGLAVSEHAPAAETLWVELSRSLPDPWRAEALVLLGFSAYARGDGPLAGVALEAALRAAPQHRMAGMLDTALQSGLRPGQIRQLADTAYGLARRLGSRLPSRPDIDSQTG